MIKMKRKTSIQNLAWIISYYNWLTWVSSATEADWKPIFSVDHKQSSLSQRQQRWTPTISWWRESRIGRKLGFGVVVCDNVLSRMAIDILSIPAMPSEPERIFSASKRTIKETRWSLKSYTIEALKCLKAWFQAEIFTNDEHRESAILLNDEVEDVVATPDSTWFAWSMLSWREIGAENKGTCMGGVYKIIGLGGLIPSIRGKMKSNLSVGLQPAYSEEAASLSVCSSRLILHSQKNSRSWTTPVR